MTTPASIPAPGHLLGPADLEALACSIAARPELWRPLVDLDPDVRRYGSLYVDEHVGVWIISWMPGHDTGFHDHGDSSGGVCIARGTLQEDRPRWGHVPRRINPVAGESFSFDGTEIHAMRNASGEPAVSVHCYSPPLRSMGVYRQDELGHVRRTAVPYDFRLVAA